MTQTEKDPNSVSISPDVFETCLMHSTDNGVRFGKVTKDILHTHQMTVCLTPYASKDKNIYHVMKCNVDDLNDSELVKQMKADNFKPKVVLIRGTQGLLIEDTDMVMLKLRYA